MQEKEEFNKSLLEPLFLHLKTRLPRCEVEQISTFVLDDKQIQSEEPFVCFQTSK